MLSSFPVKYSMSSFTYLGLHITPTFQLLFKSNFAPLLEKIHNDLQRWNVLPVSFLGRIAIIKMNILPRLMYPLMMLPILLSSKVIKELNGWLSCFIWSKRKPKLKMSKLQLPSHKGGLDVPNIRLYQLACQLRFVADWLKNDPGSIWLDLEASQSLCPLQNLLFVVNPKKLKFLYDSPIIRNTLKAWAQSRKLEGRFNLTSALTPIKNNPDFPPGTDDSGFNLWNSLGIVRLKDIFEDSSLLSFEQLSAKFNLPKHNFFRYLQLRDFIGKKTTLYTDNSKTEIEKILIEDTRQKKISHIYVTLSLTLPGDTDNLRQMWENDFIVNISREDWDLVWDHAKRISVCNRARAIQFKIIRRLHITPYIRNKMDPKLSPNCSKCKISVDNYIHCIWSCHKIQLFWKKIAHHIGNILGMTIDVDPCSFILGLPAGTVLNKYHKRLFSILTFAARKNILMFWISEKTPSIKKWHSLVKELIPMEFLTCMLHSSTDVFKRIWTPYFDYVSLTLDNCL